MTLFKSLAACVLTLLLAFTFTACGDSAATNDADTTTVTAPHGEGKEYTSAYVCPMHCDDSGSATAGTCPVCGMTYVENEAHTKDGHQH